MSQKIILTGNPTCQIPTLMMGMNNVELFKSSTWIGISESKMKGPQNIVAIYFVKDIPIVSTTIATMFEACSCFDKVCINFNLLLFCFEMS